MLLIHDLSKFYLVFYSIPLLYFILLYFVLFYPILFLLYFIQSYCFIIYFGYKYVISTYLNIFCLFFYCLVWWRKIDNLILDWVFLEKFRQFYLLGKGIWSNPVPWLNFQQIGWVQFKFILIFNMFIIFIALHSSAISYLIF